jgi:hypothetical protein
MTWLRRIAGRQRAGNAAANRKWEIGGPAVAGDTGQDRPSPRPEHFGWRRASRGSLINACGSARRVVVVVQRLCSVQDLGTEVSES